MRTKPNEQSKKFILSIWHYNIKPIDIVFNEDGLGGFTAIYSDGKRIPSFEFPNFLHPVADRHNFNNYLDTFK